MGGGGALSCINHYIYQTIRATPLIVPIFISDRFTRLFLTSPSHHTAFLLLPLRSWIKIAKLSSSSGKIYMLAFFPPLLSGHNFQLFFYSSYSSGHNFQLSFLIFLVKNTALSFPLLPLTCISSRNTFQFLFYSSQFRTQILAYLLLFLVQDTTSSLLFLLFSVEHNQ